MTVLVGGTPLTAFNSIISPESCRLRVTAGGRGNSCCRCQDFAHQVVGPWYTAEGVHAELNGGGPDPSATALANTGSRQTASPSESASFSAFSIAYGTRTLLSAIAMDLITLTSSPVPAALPPTGLSIQRLPRPWRLTSASPPSLVFHIIIRPQLRMSRRGGAGRAPSKRSYDLDSVQEEEISAKQ